MVVSHERSGTHFTMNTLAACFGYASLPWVELDAREFNINYFHPRMLQALVQALADLRTASLVKSHHEAAFFAEFLGELRGLDIVYVHRHPADAMASLWRFLHTWPWIEGPKAASPVELARTPPQGQLMRYQHRQYGTMLDRWANHVEGWLDAARRFEHVHLVRYEDLARDFPGTVARLAGSLQVTPLRLVRPSPHDNVVKPGPIPFTGVESDHDRDLVTRLALRRHPELMGRLGYVEPAGLRLAQAASAR